MPASTACSLPDEQQQHYCEVLTCLHDHDIVINPAESVSKLSIWNFVTSCWLHWHQALESKVQVICDFPKPTTQHKLRESLGLVNFYHRFIPNCAAILVPLNSMLSSAQHSHSPLNWFPAAESAFTQLKDVLADASLLEHPLWWILLILQWGQFLGSVLVTIGAQLLSFLRSYSPMSRR